MFLFGLITLELRHDRTPSLFKMLHSDYFKITLSGEHFFLVSRVCKYVRISLFCRWREEILLNINKNLFQVTCHSLLTGFIMDNHFISARWYVKIAKNAKIDDRIQKTSALVFGSSLCVFSSWFDPKNVYFLVSWHAVWVVMPQQFWLMRVFAKEILYIF